MSDGEAGPVDPGPGGALGRARTHIGLAILCLGAAIGLIVLAWSAVSDERRRPDGYRGYADALESRCHELAGSVEALRDRADELTKQRDESHAGQIRAVNRANAAEQTAHEAQVHGQVAIAAALGIDDPWGPPAPAAEGNGQPAANEAPSNER